MLDRLTCYWTSQTGDWAEELKNTVIRIDQTIHDKVGILFDVDTHGQEQFKPLSS